MARIETFSVWIYDKDTLTKSQSDHPSTCYILSDSRPCDLPKSNFVHLIGTASPDGQRLTQIEGAYFYGPRYDDVIVINYSSPALTAIEQNIGGSGSLLNRIMGQIQLLPFWRQKDLLDQYDFPCFGDVTTTLVQLFVFQMGVTLLVAGWLRSDLFWKHHLLPLYARLPLVPGFLDQQTLESIVIYVLYLYSMTDLRIDLRSSLDICLSFVDGWGSSWVPGSSPGINLFIAQLNLGFAKYLSSREEPKQITLVDHVKKPYQILEIQRAEIERKASQINRSLTSHFSTLSHEVIGHAMKEIRDRLDGCIEEEILRSLPRIEGLIDTAFNDKSKHLDRLALEADQTCRYEERIKDLEDEIAVLRRHQNPNLERKVEHLQSTVTQLLRTIRCRP